MGYSDEGMGRIVRVQMHAEAPSLEECQRALNAGFMTIHSALAMTMTLVHATGGGVASFSQPGSYAGVFSRETEFGDEVFESQVRQYDGSIYYRGRRTISFVEPYERAPEAESALEDSMATLVRGTLASDDDRIRAIQRMPEVGSVDVGRAGNGVWFVSVYKRGPGLLSEATGPPVLLANGTGGTLREALEEAESQLEITTATDGFPFVPEEGTPATAEEVLEQIRGLENVLLVSVQQSDGTPDGDLWVVRAQFRQPSRPTVAHANVSLLEAALQTYADCGEVVTEYRQREEHTDASHRTAARTGLVRGDE